MSIKYHINPDTGRPNQCSATVRHCKYSQGNLLPEHYDTREEAMKAYEEQNKANIPKSFSKNTKPSAWPTFAPPPKDHYAVIEIKKGTPSSTEAFATPGENQIYLDSPGQKKVAFNRQDYLDVVEHMKKEFSNWRDTVNIDQDGDEIEFNEGEWTNPSNADYHAADRHYIHNPSFLIRDKKVFTSNLFSSFSNVPITTNLMLSFEEIGLYDENNYEAEINGGYYGENFDGFKLNSQVQEKAIDIMSTAVMLHKSFRN